MIFMNVCNNFLVNIQADNYQQIIRELFSPYEAFGFNMLHKIYFLDSHLNFFAENLGAAQDEHFLQTSVITERIFQVFNILRTINLVFGNSILPHCKPLYLLIKLTKAFGHKQYCFTAFLDIKQAFNKVSHMGIFAKIRSFLPHLLLSSNYIISRGIVNSQKEWILIVSISRVECLKKTYWVHTYILIPWTSL